MNRFLSFILLFVASSIFGQMAPVRAHYGRANNHLCGHSEAEAKMLADHPEVATLRAGFKDALKKRQQELYANPSLKADGDYVIPVVVHILHANGEENISDEQVLDAIATANDYFNGSHPNVGDVIPQFQGIVADVPIELRLAKLDPNGNCSSGIMRYYDEKTFSADDAVMVGKQWPASQYLNVYVVDDIASGAAGYAKFPGVPANIDGIVLQHSIFGSIGTGSLNSNPGFVHEIGHYLNLYHTWGPGNTPESVSNCNQDDEVSDTPLCAGVSSSTVNGNCGGTFNTCDEGAGDLPDNHQNFMDYAYCFRMFTEGQSARMVAALESTLGDRNNLWSEANLAATGVEDGFVAATDLCNVTFDQSKTELASGGVVTFTDYSINGVVSREWDFPGGTFLGSGGSNDSIVYVKYDTPGVYSVSLTVSDAGSNQLSDTKVNAIEVYGKSILSESFSNGFSGENELGVSWTTGSVDGVSAWEYRGTSTSPNNQTGGRGECGDAFPPLSESVADGFMIFDANFLDDGSSGCGNGDGTVPGPHTAHLTSSSIDLTGLTAAQLEFYAEIILFNGGFDVQVSTNGGGSWSTIDRIFESSNTYNTIYTTFKIDLTPYVGNNLQLRFLFDSYYYQAMLDDVRLIDMSADQDPVSPITCIDGQGRVVFEVLEPGSLAGEWLKEYARPDGGWGVADLSICNNSVTGELAFIEDGVEADRLGCNAISNPAVVDGKIAVLYRGGCEFGLKAKNAQDAGAIGVVMINNTTDAVFIPGGGTDGPDVSIPFVFMDRNDGLVLEPEIENGGMVAYIGQKTDEGPVLFIDPLYTKIAPAKAIPQVLALNSFDFQYTPVIGVQNGGAFNQFGVQCIANVYKNTELFYSDTTVVDVVAGDLTQASFKQFFLPQNSENYYLIEYKCIASGEEDYTLDNTYQSYFNITENLLTYHPLNESGADIAPTSATRPGGAYSDYGVCMQMYNPNLDALQLDRVSFYADSDNDLTGEPIDIKVYTHNVTNAGLVNLSVSGDLSEVASVTHTYVANEPYVLQQVDMGDLPLLQSQRYLVCAQTQNPAVYLGVYNIGDINYQPQRVETQEITGTAVLLDDILYSTGFGDHVIGGLAAHFNVIDPAVEGDDFDFSNIQRWLGGEFSGTTLRWAIGNATQGQKDFMGEIASNTAANGYAYISNVDSIVAFNNNGTPYNDVDAFIQYGTAIDISEGSNLQLSFHQRYRAFNSDQTFIGFSADGGNNYGWYEVNEALPFGETADGAILFPIPEQFRSDQFTFAFRWTAPNNAPNYQFGGGYGWMIDDIELIAAADTNLVVQDAFLFDVVNKTAYEAVTQSQIPSAGLPVTLVTQSYGNDTYNAPINVYLHKPSGGVSIFAGSSVLLDYNQKDSLTAFVPRAAFDEIGVYHIRAYVGDTVKDAFAPDNFASLHIAITEDIISHEKDAWEVKQHTVSFDAGGGMFKPFAIGTYNASYNTEDVYGCSFILDNATVEGSEITIKVKEFLGGGSFGPDLSIQTKTIAAGDISDGSNPSAATWVEVRFPNAISFEEGKTYALFLESAGGEDFFELAINAGQNKDAAHVIDIDLGSGRQLYSYTASYLMRLHTNSDFANEGDTEAPQVFLPDAIQAFVDVTCSAIIEIVVDESLVSDNVSSDAYLKANMTNSYTALGDTASGTFPLGLTQVVFTVTDEAGNSTKDTIVVEVLDNTSPFIDCAANTEIENTNPGGNIIVGLLGSGNLITHISDNCGVLDTLVVLNNDTLGAVTNISVGTGLHEVRVIVSDFSGNVTVCQFDLNITEPIVIDGLTVVVGNDIPGSVGNQVVVPVYLYEFVNIIGISGDINFSNATLNVDSVSDFALPGFNPATQLTVNQSIGRVSFSWDEASLNPVTLPEMTIMFNLYFTVSGGDTNDEFPISLTNLAALNGDFEEITVNGVDGSVLIVPFQTIAGQVQLENGTGFGDNIYVVANYLDNGDIVLDTAATDASGNYSFQVPSGAEVTLTAFKDNLTNPKNGVNVADVIFVRRHVLGTLLESRFKQMAADVTANTSINVADVINVRRLILGSITDFSGLAWRFADLANDSTLYDGIGDSRNYRILRTVNSDITDAHFVAVKLGDVNETFNPSNGSLAGAPTELIALPEFNYVANQMVKIPFVLTQDVQISGYQFTLNWNQDQANFVAVAESATQPIIETSRAASGQITVAWNEDNGAYLSLNKGDTLMYLQLATQHAAEETLQVALTSKETPAMWFNDAVAGKTISSVQVTGINSGGNANNQRFASATRVFPNPVDGTSRIELPSGLHNVQLTLFDVQGKQIAARETQAPVIAWSDLLNGKSISTGSYVLQVRSDEANYSINISYK